MSLSTLPDGTDAPSLRARLSEIDREMAQLQARLAHLAAARKPIVESLKSIFYPVITLPPEITAKIFLHYVKNVNIGGTGDGIPYAPGGRVGGCDPLLLASVCRTWRAIALALPPIWSAIKLYAGKETISPTENLLQLWLPRAGSHPLEIEIFDSHSAEDLMPLLAPPSPQWQSFSCGIIQTTFPGHLIQGRIPLLRSLEVYLLEEWEELPGPALVTECFADAPQLRDVKLGDFTLERISLPWAQLTGLDFSGQTTAAQCLEILQHTPYLETLSLDFRSGGIALSSVRLDHLHTLKFGRYQENIDIIDNLTLPVLTQLALPSARDLEILPRFPQFIARSGCSLRLISIDATYGPAATAYLRCVPTVRVVRISRASWSETQFLHFFRSISQERGFLPHLQSLSLDPCTAAAEIPYTALAEMLASRWRRHESPRLEAFELNMAVERTLDFDPPIEVAQVEHALTELQALAADGLKLNIRALQKMAPTADPWALCP